MRKKIALGIVAYEGVQKAAVYGLCDLFEIANKYSLSDNAPVFDVQVLSEPPAASASYACVIVPPNLSGARGREDVSWHHWLVKCQQDGTLLCSVCAGAFWLAYAGVLENRVVTTHWGLAQELAEAFPKTRVNAERLLIDLGDIVSAGGMMAWVDLGLYIVKKWQGPQAMTQTARHLLVDTGGREQKNYRSFEPRLDHGDGAILKAQNMVQQKIAGEIIIADLAKVVGLSERTFIRRFKKATSFAPLSYVQQMRMETARALLEQTHLPVSEVGWRVGYSDAAAFSRIFKAQLGLTAGEYRKRFSVLSAS